MCWKGTIIVTKVTKDSSTRTEPWSYGNKEGGTQIFEIRMREKETATFQLTEDSSEENFPQIWLNATVNVSLTLEHFELTHYKGKVDCATWGQVMRGVRRWRSWEKRSAETDVGSGNYSGHCKISLLIQDDDTYLIEAIIPGIEAVGHNIIEVSGKNCGGVWRHPNEEQRMTFQSTESHVRIQGKITDSSHHKLAGKRVDESGIETTVTTWNLTRKLD